MERKQRKNDEGPLVYRYESVPMVDEGVVPPWLGNVNVPNKSRAVERLLDGDLRVKGNLLEHVLHDFLGRFKLGVHLGGSGLV
jgi:hypothetical protein